MESANAETLDDKRGTFGELEEQVNMFTSPNMSWMQFLIADCGCWPEHHSRVLPCLSELTFHRFHRRFCFIPSLCYQANIAKEMNIYKLRAQTSTKASASSGRESNIVRDNNKRDLSRWERGWLSFAVWEITDVVLTLLCLRSSHRRQKNHPGVVADSRTREI